MLSFYYFHNRLSFKYKFIKEINDYGRKIDAIKGFLFENVLSVVSEQGKDILKENVVPLITNELARQGGDILIDYGASLIPGIGGAITEFRTNKKLKI